MFKVSLGYTARPCLNEQNKTKFYLTDNFSGYHLSLHLLKSVPHCPRQPSAPSPQHRTLP
jgi:hypothetical protein